MQQTESATISIGQAIDRLKEELNKDKAEGSYYYAWQANIAMAFYDQFVRYKTPSLHETIPIEPKEVHEIANNAAKNFLDSLSK